MLNIAVFTSAVVTKRPLRSTKALLDSRTSILNAFNILLFPIFNPILTLFHHSINATESKYYADGEDAYDMRKLLKEGASFGGRSTKSSADASMPPSLNKDTETAGDKPDTPEPATEDAEKSN